MYHFYSMWFLVPVFTILCNMISKIFFFIKKCTFQNAWREHLCNLHSNPLNLGHVDTIWSPSRTFEICTEKDKPLVVYQCSFWYGLNTHQKFVNKNKQKLHHYLKNLWSCNTLWVIWSSETNWILRGVKARSKTYKINEN